MSYNSIVRNQYDRKGKMKILSALMMAICLGTWSMHGQVQETTYPVTVHAGYGVLTARLFFESIASAIFTGIFPTDDKLDVSMGYGPVIVGVYKPLNRWFGVGIDAGVYEMRYTWTSKQSDVVTHRYRSSRMMILPRIDVLWMNDEKIVVSSGAALGGSFLVSGTNEIGSYEMSESTTLAEFQFNILTVQSGGDVGGFLEIGFGSRGLFHGGLYVRL